MCIRYVVWMMQNTKMDYNITGQTENQIKQNDWMWLHGKKSANVLANCLRFHGQKTSYVKIGVLFAERSETRLSTGKLHSELNQNVIQRRLFNASIECVLRSVLQRWIALKLLTLESSTPKRMHHPKTATNEL